MSYADDLPLNSGHRGNSDDTFCSYLAKQFIAKRGFQFRNIPEAKTLFTASNIVLTRSDGYLFTILCMIDRESHPSKVFAVTPDEVVEIGKACLKYSGSIGGAKLPVHIMILEVGPGSPTQQQRLKQFKRPSLLSKVIPTAMAVDTTESEVWYNQFSIGGAGYRTFVTRLLLAPREADSEMAPPTVTPTAATFPVLTTAILAILFAVFAAEIGLGIGPWTELLKPTTTTLVGFGGLMRDVVFQYGEWYRLLAAPFLHADAAHLAMNAIALLIAGRRLESLLGRAWLCAIYTVGALCGSLASLALNPASAISVGASGAVMALFAAMLIVSLHFPGGAARTGLQMNAIYVLIPSLLPLASAFQGQTVDYAAHFGGAVGGAAVGFAMLAIWSRAEARPKFGRIATGIAIAGTLALAYPVTAILLNYPVVVLSSQLIPPDKFPRFGSVSSSQTLELLVHYPRDPRAHLMRAGDLMAIQEMAGVEREARLGLAEEHLWQSILPAIVATNLRVALAVALADEHRDEALTVAQPVCSAMKDGPQRGLLDAYKLCGT